MSGNAGILIAQEGNVKETGGPGKQSALGAGKGWACLVPDSTSTWLVISCSYIFRRPKSYNLFEGRS
jgi:hypothetical protein